MGPENIEHTTKPRCIACDAEAKSFLQHDGISEMFQCPGCGLIFADPQDFLAEDEYTVVEDISQLREEQRAEFSRVFSEGIDTSDVDGNMYADFGMEQEAMAAGLFALVAEAIERYTSFRRSDPIRMLDVGCATGFLLNEAAKSYPNAKLYGVEPSPVSCQKAKTLYGFEIHQGTMNTFDPQGERFDVVSIIGNLQLHEDPFLTLNQVLNVMNSGGVLVYHMKNPFSAARRIARVAASTPAIKNTKLTRLAVERGYLCMRYAASKSMLARKTDEIGFETREVRTIPPRMLAYSTRAKAHGKGVVGQVWKALDHIDRTTNQRAWIQVTCTKP